MSRTRTFASLAVSVTLLASLVTAVSAPSAVATDRITQMSGFNARAWTVTPPDANGIRYVGGDFTSFQAWQTGRAARVSLSNGSVDATFPSVNGEVQAVAPDGNGGYVIGGNFGSVDGQTRTRLAHIQADGSLNPNFAPVVNNQVLSVAVVGSTVIIGGLFEQVNSTARLRVAALDLSNGNLLSWNPSANSWVRVVRVVGNSVYVGGQFGSLGGLTRNRLAQVRLDARTSPAAGTCLDNWDSGDCITDFAPTFGDYGVFDVAVSGTTVYATGSFSITPSGGSRLSNLAAMSTSTIANNAGVSTWNGAIDAEASALTIHNGVLYVGGQFSQAGGQARGMGAAFDISTSPLTPTLTSWNPRAVAGGSYNNARQITDIEIAGSTAYLAGSYWALGTATGSVARNRIGAVDLVNGDATAWDPHICDYTNGVSATSYDIAVSGTSAVFGGDFSCVGGLQRKHAAAIGPDGILTSWAPAVDGPVLAFASNGQTIYMSGNFAQVVGQDGSGGSRTRAAAVTVGGSVASWAPSLNDRPVDLLVSGTSVYLAGFFSTVGGVSRVGLARVDATSGALDSGFDADLNGAAEHLALANGRLYLAGRFSTAGGQARPNYAAVNATTGALDSWNVGTPNASNSAGESHGRGLFGTAIAVMGDRVYLGGSFLSITPANSSTPVTQRYTAAVDAVTGALDLAWRPATVRGHNGNGDVYEIATTSTAIYLGGDNDFSITDNGATRQRLAAVDPRTGALLTWDAQAGAGEIRGLSTSTAAVFIAGSFSSIGGATRQNTAAMGRNGVVADPWPMNPSTTQTVAVTTTSQRTDQGSVVSSPPGLTCEDGSDSCTYGFTSGQTVTLTAVPASGASFERWDGACSGSNPTCTVTIGSTTTVTARFVSGSGSGSGSGSSGSGSSDGSSPGGSNSGMSNQPAGAQQGSSATIQAETGSASAGPTSVTILEGSRTRSGGGDRIEVRLRTSGLPVGAKLQPMIRFVGQKTFQPGEGLVTVDGGEPLLWSTIIPSGRGLELYFVTAETQPTPVASNRARWSTNPGPAEIRDASQITVSKLTRLAVRGEDRVRAQITTDGLAPGSRLQPMVRWAGQTSFRATGKPVVVRDNGSARWSTKVPAEKSLSVYFVEVTTTDKPISSNRVSWKNR